MSESIKAWDDVERSKKEVDAGMDYFDKNDNLDFDQQDFEAFSENISQIESALPIFTKDLESLKNSLQSYIKEKINEDETYTPQGDAKLLEIANFYEEGMALQYDIQEFIASFGSGNSDTSSGGLDTTSSSGDKGQKGRQSTIPSNSQTDMQVGSGFMDQALTEGLNNESGNKRYAAAQRKKSESAGNIIGSGINGLTPKINTGNEGTLNTSEGSNALEKVIGDGELNLVNSATKRENGETKTSFQGAKVKADGTIDAGVGYAKNTTELENARDDVLISDAKNSLAGLADDYSFFVDDFGALLGEKAKRLPKSFSDLNKVTFDRINRLLDAVEGNKNQVNKAKDEVKRIYEEGKKQKETANLGN